MRNLVVLLGVPIDNLDLNEVIDQIDHFVQKGRAEGKYHLVVTVNADFVVKASSDPELRYLLQESDLATADGMPLVWASKILRVPLKGRVTGADMVPLLAERAAQKGYSVFFFGAAPGVAQKAADLLREKYRGLKIAGVASPPIPTVLEMDPAVLAQMEAARPDILLVALGNPKQEKWIGMYGHRLNVPVMIGVGGSLDFVAGQVKRAPVWMQKTGLEWSYRFLQEPGRLWKRYVVDLFAFSVFFARQWWAMRGKQTPLVNLPSTELMIIENKAVINLQSRVTMQNVKDVLEIGRQALEKTPQIFVNLSRTEFIDSSGIGALVNLAKQARSKGGDLALVAIPPQIESTIRLLHLNNFFPIYPDAGAAIATTLTSQQPVAELQVMNAVVSEQFHHTWTILNSPRRFDAMTANEFQSLCKAKIECNPYLILDLSETIILTSAGLAVLAHLNKFALERQGELRVANCSKEVLQTIRMVRMDKILAIYPEILSATAVTAS